MGEACNSEKPEKVKIEGGRVARGSQMPKIGWRIWAFNKSCTGKPGRVQLVQLCGEGKEQVFQ